MLIGQVLLSDGGCNNEEEDKENKRVSEMKRVRYFINFGQATSKK